MSDAEALLKSVIANPADDLPRLMYADALEETAGTVACDWCGGSGEDRRPGPIDTPRGRLVYTGPVGPCPKCKGAGYVSDGLAEYAEFIRVEIEIASLCEQHRNSRNTRTDTERQAALFSRERELARTVYPKHVHPKFYWLGSLGIDYGGCVFNRGSFLHTVRGPLATLREHLPSIVAREPVERVEVTDRHPIRFTPDSGESSFDWTVRWSWGRARDREFSPQFIGANPHFLPDDVWGHMPRERAVGRYKRFDTESDATATLSACLLAEARERSLAAAI